jgi:hypothetical protein
MPRPLRAESPAHPSHSKEDRRAQHLRERTVGRPKGDWRLKRLRSRCSGPRSLPSCARLGRARAPVPTRALRQRALDLVLDAPGDRREKSSREPPCASWR